MAKDLIAVESMVALQDIVAQTQLPSWRVSYLLKSRRIRPVRKVGQVRLFLPSAVELIRSAAADIDGARMRRQGAGS